tara:strand:+ start:348 stop:1784 length:1437 start_codon:yes stop_codon:yes gene_type:complete
MAYIGKINKSTSTLATQTMDSMTGDGTTTTLSLTSTPANVNDVSIYTDGVMQEPGVDYTLDGNTVTFTTAVPLNCYVCACQTQNGDIGTPAADSVTTAKLTDGMFTDSHIPSLSASKLTGALPAIDGSALTGVGSGFMENASDPATDTNPADGLGAVWVNTTTGSIYICTDATADANVWNNVGEGSGDVAPYYYGGDIAGFTSGGYVPNSASNVIDQFSYTSNTTASDHGDLGTAVNNGAGAQSSTDGYHFGGSAGGASNMFNKFSFASAGNATSVGTIDTSRSSVAGYSSSTHGFYSGGTPANDSAVKKFAFSNESSISAHGSLQDARYGNAATSSETHGFKMGGYPKTVTIDKFAFASNSGATDHGDLRANRNDNTGHSDMTNGYSAGGETSSGGAAIDKFAFASNTTASGHGDLSADRKNGAGHTYKTTHGYVAGGTISGHVASIDKFAFASNTTAAGHGNLSVAREYGPWGNNY